MSENKPYEKIIKEKLQLIAGLAYDVNQNKNDFEAMFSFNKNKYSLFLYEKGQSIREGTIVAPNEYYKQQMTTRNGTPFVAAPDGSKLILLSWQEINERLDDHIKILKAYAEKRMEVKV